MNTPAKTHSEPDRDRALIEGAAGAWLSLRDEGMMPAETEAFLRWLAADPRHQEVFDGLERIWRQLDGLAELAVPTAAPNAELFAPRYRRRVAPIPAALLGLAAALAMVCGVALLHPARHHYAETGLGAFQRVDLPDGSVAELNTDSAIDADMAGTFRRVRLVRGEVHFKVKKDATRPFIVTGGPVQVRAVGTAFSVRTEAAAVDVVVNEGRVQLQEADTGTSLLPQTAGASAPAVLGAGEKAVVSLPAAARGPAASPHVRVLHLSDDEVRRELAWRDRTLEFDALPLDQVVAEFNRYNAVKLRVTDPALGRRAFSGTFQVDGCDTLVDLLERDFGVRAARDKNEICLSAH